MHKRLIILCLAAWMTVASGCGSKEKQEDIPSDTVVENFDQEDLPVAELPELSENTKEDAEESITFSDADLRWLLPKGFKELKGEEGIYVHKSYPKDTSIVSYVISESNTDFSDISKEEFQDLLEDDFYNEYGDDITVSISKYEKNKVNERTALRIDFTYMLKGINYLQTEVMIFNGDETHIINYTQDEDGRWTEEFEKSISSFSFVE